MHNKTTILIALVITLSALNPALAEDEMDVDLADSLDFEAFHTDKKAAIKVCDKKETEKTYENNAEAKTAEENTSTAQPEITQPAETATKSKKGKRYEIRELYTISGSDRTGYTPTTVTQALFLQMQGLCPNGWRKLDERSQPDGNDAFYMYYSFECL